MLPVRRTLGPVLLTLACAAGCADRGAPRITPSPQAGGADGAPASVAAPEVDPRVDTLYAELADTAEAYERGIERIVLGEEVEGETRTAAAASRLSELAAECDALEGCEMQRVLATFDRLLDRQELALKQQTYRVGELQRDAESDVEREPGTSPFVAAMPEVGETVSLLHGNELRDLIELNGPVKAALDDWLTWMRPMLVSAVENYRYLRDQVAPVYEEAGLPEALLFAMMATETGVKVHAHSRAGAAGPLQFMRRTGQRYGLGVVDGFDTRLDPVESTRANVAYLNDQFAVLNDSLEKALAAYNGGENRMRNLERRYAGASLWDSRVYYALPRETREYVPRILAAAWLFLHPEQYGLELSVSPARSVPLTLREEIALDELTICLGQAAGSRDGWFRTLRNLNPRLEPGERVPAGETIVVPEALPPIYEERCLEGELVDRARELHDANYPEEPELIVYTVRRGDTLSKIAARHSCVGLGELAAINGIHGPRYVIRVGQQIKIPACS